MITISQIEDEITDSRDIIELYEDMLDDLNSIVIEHPSNSEDTCKDIINLKELDLDADFKSELTFLIEIIEGFENYGEWDGGCSVIPEDLFEDYTKELIDECYGIPDTSAWPMNHMNMDCAAAADELRIDYCEENTSRGTFLMRA